MNDNIPVRLLPAGCDYDALTWMGVCMCLSCAMHILLVNNWTYIYIHHYCFSLSWSHQTGLLWLSPACLHYCLSMLGERTCMAANEILMHPCSYTMVLTCHMHQQWNQSYGHTGWSVWYMEIFSSVRKATYIGIDGISTMCVEKTANCYEVSQWFLHLLIFRFLWWSMKHVTVYIICAASCTSALVWLW
jgi:hypothetical protein